MALREGGLVRLREVGLVRLTVWLRGWQEREWEREGRDGVGLVLSNERWKKLWLAWLTGGGMKQDAL